MEHIDIKMAIDMQDIGKIIRGMVKEFSIHLSIIFKVIGKTD
jgi:hypothetical protein